MPNSLKDLNDKLFEQLDRLGEHNLKGFELCEEINRSRAVVDVASTIISNASLALKVQLAYDENISANVVKPNMLEA